MKDLIRRPYAFARRQTLTARHAVRSAMNQRPIVGHHGIQRSGTNYLSAVLRQHGYFVTNEVDPPRDHPRHKHFRWQDAKNTVVMDNRFRNDLRAASVHDVNVLAGFPVGLRHIVIFKEPANWLPSISRWAMQNRWIGENDDPYSHPQWAEAWLREWDAYYAKWAEFRDRDPSFVMLVSYEALTGNSGAVMDRIHQLLGVVPNAPLVAPAVIAKVPHSSARRAGSSVERAEADSRIQDLVDRVVTWEWQEHRYE